jgi:hypothetical protein
MDKWWNYLGTTSCRDQLTLNFALWQNGITYRTIPGIARRNKLAYWMGHRGNTETDMRTRLIEHEREMLFLYQQLEDAAASSGAVEASHLGNAGGSVQQPSDLDSRSLD